MGHHGFHHDQTLKDSHVLELESNLLTLVTVASVLPMVLGRALHAGLGFADGVTHPHPYGRRRPRSLCRSGPPSFGLPTCDAHRLCTAAYQALPDPARLFRRRRASLPLMSAGCASPSCNRRETLLPTLFPIPPESRRLLSFRDYGRGRVWNMHVHAPDAIPSAAVGVHAQAPGSRFQAFCV